MTLDFQKNLLRYLTQIRNIKDYIVDIDSNIFDTQDDKAIFSFIQSYVEDYNYQPSEINLIEYIDKRSKKDVRLKQDVKEHLFNVARECFTAIASDTEIYNSTILDFVQRKRIQRFLEENANVLNDFNAELNMSKWVKEFSSINNLRSKEFQQASGGAFLFKDFDKIIIDKKSSTPTFLRALNMMTADGGFFSPQLITVMSGPKGFKTGTCINLAKNFIMKGKKVFYADFENSYRSIINRIYQSMLECTKKELLDVENNIALKKMSKLYSDAGGELRSEYFPAHMTTLDDVDNKIQELYEEFGWTPDIIIYDYLDLAGCADKTIREKRLQIQYNYHHAVRLNNKYKTFAITMSQISKDAWKMMQTNRYIDMSAFSEDFGKAMNCHAAFAMCRSEEDIEKKHGYLIPIVQREGLKYMKGIHCMVKIDENKQIMKENEQYTDNELVKIINSYNS